MDAVDAQNLQPLPQSLVIQDSPVEGNGTTAAARQTQTAPTAQQARLNRPAAAVSQPRPFIPQVDLAEFVDTLLGDPEKTLKQNTLLGSALATDGVPCSMESTQHCPSVDAQPAVAAGVLSATT